jgi:hypothetical protein
MAESQEELELWRLTLSSCRLEKFSKWPSLSPLFLDACFQGSPRKWLDQSGHDTIVQIEDAPYCCVEDP